MDCGKLTHPHPPPHLLQIIHPPHYMGMAPVDIAGIDLDHANRDVIEYNNQQFIKATLIKITFIPH